MQRILSLPLSAEMLARQTTSMDGAELISLQLLQQHPHLHHAKLGSTAHLLPYNAGGIFAASDGMFVYAGGGADLAKGIFHKDLLQYDPVNDSWTTLAPSPDYHYHSQAVYFNGKIYNIGGYNENLEVTDTTRIYDIDTNTWTTGAPMPQALAQMATALWDGVIYVAGGNNSDGAGKHAVRL